MTLVKTMGGSRSAQERHVLPATVDVKMAATRSPIQFRSPLAVSATVSTESHRVDVYLHQLLVLNLSWLLGSLDNA